MFGVRGWVGAGLESEEGNLFACLERWCASSSSSCLTAQAEALETEANELGET